MIWEEIKLDKICNVINGGAWSQGEYVSSGVKVIKVSNLVNDGIDEASLSFLPFEALSTYEKNILKAYDLVVTTVGSHPQLKASAAGRGFIIPTNFEGALLNQNTVCIRTKDENILHSRYLGYIGRSDDFRNYIQQTGRGAANQMRIPISNLKSFNIHLPPLETQKRIALILSNYDDLIENNNKRIKLLEETAQNIFKEWFVNFRFPNYENTEFDEESGVPVGWENCRLTNIFDIQGGTQPPKSEWKETLEDGYVRMIQIRDYYTESHIGFVKDKSTLKKCFKEDIMIARYGASVGRICWGLEGAYNVALAKVIPENKVYLSFLRWFLKSDYFQSSLLGMTQRTAQDGFNKETFNSIYTIKPDIKTLKSFEKVEVNLFLQLEKLKENNQILKEARDIMLPRLMSRTIDV